MNNFGKILAVAIAISTVVVAPLVIMETVNRRGETYQYPFMLFAVLWTLAAAFFVVLLVMARRVFASSSATNYAVLPLFAGCAFLIVVGIFWGGLVADQMPCFLGVPNCD